jgi:predicted P-loop ATPase
MSGLIPDAAEACRFLSVFRPGGPHVLTAIALNGAIATQTFTDAKVMEGWIAERNAKQENIYFAVNPLMRPVSKKGSKAECRGMAFLHCDVDPRHNEPLDSERDRIRRLLSEFNPPPTFIVDSGNGFQALWMLDAEQPVNGDVAVAEKLEAYNIQLEMLLGADACHDLSRVLRLPGTVNWPTTKKREAGRIPNLARVAREDVNLVYPLSAFTPAQRKGGATSTGTASVNVPPGPLRRVELNDLPPGVNQRMLPVLVQGDDFDHPYPSKSHAVWAVSCELVRAGCDDQTIASLLLDTDLKISEHVYRQSHPQQYTARQIKRAKEAVAADFKRDEDGKIVASSQHNIRLAVHKLGLTLSHDEFQDQMLITGLHDIGPLLDDRAMEDLWLLVDETFGFRPSKDLFWTVVSVAARKNNFHPVREYLDSLQWDGVPRVDQWLHAYGGAETTAYVQAVGSLMLVAAVRRIRTPGVKFDELVVLEGSQGTNKSSALKALAVKDAWFSDDMPLNASGKEVIERQRGRWIVECAELQGMRKSELEHVKAFLSRQTDRARMSYDRLTTEVPRQSVFIGSTNSSRYLRDLTGARRFWPVAISKFDVAALTQDRDQLWAEAVVREAKGESIRLNPSLYDAAATEQKARSVDDPYREQLEHVLDGVMGKLLNVDAWDIIGVPMGTRDQSHNSRLGEAMKALGWDRTQGRIEGKNRKVYVRGNENERQKRIRLVKDQQGRVISVTVDEKPEHEPEPKSDAPALF